MDRSLAGRLGILALLAVASVAWLGMDAGPAAAQSLPCQAPNRGFDFDTYEATSITQYAQAIELAAAGKGFIAPYTISTGEALDFSYPGLASGAAANRQAPNAALRIPPTIFKSIVWAESGWANGTYSVPYGGVGPGLVSSDCGYGLAQITSGMGQFGSDAYAPGIPSARQALIGTDYLANLSEGARILAGKWNSAPSVRPIAGDGNPSSLENWYYAIWSYNGFVLKNHPLNPDLDPLRGGGSTVEAVYHCGDPQAPNYDPLSTGQPTYGRGDFTYPEIIYGCMRYPPYVPGQPASSQTAGAAFAAGDTAVITGGGCTNLRSQASTGASVIECLASGSSVTIAGGPQSANGYTWWQVTAPDGQKGWVAGQFLTKAGGGSSTPNPPPLVSGTGRLWQPQAFSMPDFSVPAVAAAFQLSNFAACQDAGFSGGCPAMDFPTNIPTANPPITTHTDTTPSASASLLATLIGSPVFNVSGPSSISLGISSSGSVSSATITVSNTGTAIAPFRIRTSAAWIIVNHPGDSPDRTMDGGVAVGSGTAVVLKPGSGSTPAVTQQGYQSVLQVTLNPATTPAGSSTGTLVIEPLLGGGGPVTITINASNAETGTPLTNHLRLPQVASDGPS